METLDVDIMGRSYRIACKPEEKQALLRAVNVVEMKMSAIRDTGKVVGVDKIAVMAALQIAHETIFGGNDSQPSLGFDIESLERKIEGIEQIVDESLAPEKAAENGKLF
ncbi:MAG: cell division protein ZapA [Limnobacter sp.]|nr:cell division protein ZapA [Limnobacter sp.]